MKTLNIIAVVCLMTLLHNQNNASAFPRLLGKYNEVSADETNIMKNRLDQRGLDYGEVLDNSSFEDDYLRRGEPVPLNCRWCRILKSDKECADRCSL
ncbi:hypothetical protein AWC38_SpisGene3608 [Stylophora pistillata]|uniref:Uncharacterized protein n=1 Tax=Stylophora pistillata TaxID=50429 RepID=A0A2B4SR33_STYPI|nr:hypothetical protein AWC38_SpisGene3608 [Stylophora pistillata]